MLKCQESIANNSWHFNMHEHYLKQEKKPPFSVFYLHVYMNRKKHVFGILFIHLHVCAVEIFFFCGSFMFFCVVFAMPLCASVYMCLVVICWERADLLALVCGF